MDVRSSLGEIGDWPDATPGIGGSDSSLIRGMGPMPLASASQIIWVDRNLVLTNWPPFESATRSAEAVITPEEVETPEPPVPAPTDDVQVESIGEGSSQDVETAQTRAARLRHWLDGAQSSNPELENVDDSDLLRLANNLILNDPAGIRIFAMRTKTPDLFTHFASEIAQVLGHRSEGDDIVVTSDSAPQDFLAAGWLPEAGIFADYQWPEGTSDFLDAPHKMAIRESDQGLKVSWPALSDDAAVVLYRVFYDDKRWPTLYPGGQLLGVTTSTECLVELVADSPVAYLAVWANTGPDETSARESQPVLVAQGQHVWPPTHLRLSVNPARQVTASFIAAPGGTVEVRRRAGLFALTYDTGESLPGSDVSSNGFIDKNPPIGRPVQYGAFSIATLPDNSRRVSAGVVETAEVEAEAEAVSLEVGETDAGAGSYRLSWTQPDHGDVLIFLTAEQPKSGLGDQIRTMEVLERYGLALECCLAHPVRIEGSKRTMVDVPLDPSWIKGHFVAAHKVRDDRVAVGPTHTVVRAQPPTHGIVIERVDTQVVTFGWPSGNAAIEWAHTDSRVEIYQSPRGQELTNPDPSHVLAYITQQEYQARGGVILDQSLPASGCALHLFLVVFNQGQRHLSPAHTIDYPGVVRLAYRVEPVQRDGHITAYRIMVKCDETLMSLPLAVVQSRRHIPLYPEDPKCRIVASRDLNLSPETGEQELLTLQAGPKSGPIRLFVNLGPSMCGGVAVLDPPLETLKVNLA